MEPKSKDIEHSDPLAETTVNTITESESKHINVKKAGRNLGVLPL